MKNIFKKNQVIIAALAIMIVVAGYLNFTQDKIGNPDFAEPVSQTENGKQGVTESAAPVPQGDLEDGTDMLDEQGNLINDQMELENQANNEVPDDAEKKDGEKKEEGTTTSKAEQAPGEAVLANKAIGSEFFAAAKLDREQTRAKSKETLNEIINNTKLSDDAQQEAVQKMIELTTISEKETLTETLLEAKGFPETIVTINDGGVDVVVNANELTEQQMAQIEDIVKRKTGISADHIVINPVSVLDETSEK